MEDSNEAQVSTVNNEIENGTLFHIKSDKFSIRYERNQKKVV